MKLETKASILAMFISSILIFIMGIIILQNKYNNKAEDNRCNLFCHLHNEDGDDITISIDLGSIQQSCYSIKVKRICLITKSFNKDTALY